MENNLDFLFNRTRKSGKTFEGFFEVHVKRAVIKHLITVLFFTFGVILRPKWSHKFKVNRRAILKRSGL